MAQSQSESSQDKETPRRRNMVRNTQEELLRIREQLVQDLPIYKGRIRKLRQDKGFGFIAGNDGQDYFFHWSAITAKSSRDFRALQLRDQVEFSPIQVAQDNWKAIEITYLPE